MMSAVRPWSASARASPSAIAVSRRLVAHDERHDRHFRHERRKKRQLHLERMLAGVGARLVRRTTGHERISAAARSHRHSSSQAASRTARWATPTRRRTRRSGTGRRARSRRTTALQEPVRVSRDRTRIHQPGVRGDQRARRSHPASRLRRTTRGQGSSELQREDDARRRGTRSRQPRLCGPTCEECSASGFRNKGSS